MQLTVATISNNTMTRYRNEQAKTVIKESTSQTAVTKSNTVSVIIMLYSHQVQTNKQTKNTKDRETETDGER